MELTSHLETSKCLVVNYTTRPQELKSKEFVLLTNRVPSQHKFLSPVLLLPLVPLEHLPSHRIRHTDGIPHRPAEPLPRLPVLLLHLVRRRFHLPHTEESRIKQIIPSKPIPSDTAFGLTRLDQETDQDMTLIGTARHPKHKATRPSRAISTRKKWNYFP